MNSKKTHEITDIAVKVRERRPKMYTAHATIGKRASITSSIMFDVFTELFIWGEEVTVNNLFVFKFIIY